MTAKLAIVILFVAIACNNGESPAETGTVRVTVAFSGTDPDPTRPIVSLDDTVSRQGVGAPVTFEAAAGTHQITLHGLHARCVRDGDATQTWAVVSGEITDVAFSVSCRDVDQLAMSTLDSTTGDPVLSIVDADGQRWHHIFDGTASMAVPAWSPDGRRLAFRYHLDPDQDRGAIYLVNADGTELRKIWSDPVYTPAGISWSPDGARLAVIADYDAPGSNFDYNKLVLMDTDGSNVVETDAQNGGMSVPSWAPDGTRFAFAASLNASDNDGGLIGTFTADRQGAELHQIATFAYAVDWSRDGTRIVLANGGLVTVRPDGSDPVAIPGCDFCVAARWSPDGTRLLVDNLNDVRVVSLDGTPQWSVNTDGIYGRPSWSGSGMLVAWMNSSGIGTTIVTADGSNPRVLGFISGFPGPAWRP
jgi:Tol biopolymer transport system component